MRSRTEARGVVASPAKGGGIICRLFDAKTFANGTFVERGASIDFNFLINGGCRILGPFGHGAVIHFDVFVTHDF
jgi:hypothetical protein